MAKQLIFYASVFVGVIVYMLFAFSIHVDPCTDVQTMTIIKCMGE